MLAFGALSAFAQDVIVKTDGSTILCKIIGVNKTEVIYAKWSDVNGPQYIMDRTLVSNINYQDGRQDKFSEQTTNVYAPGIQQSGTSNFNDNALIRMDASRNSVYYIKKAKKYKTIGLAVGGALFTVGTACIIGAGDWGSQPRCVWGITGGILMVGGIGTATGCLISANHYQKKAYMIASAPILEHEFNFGNGTSLCAGIDMIRDYNFKHSTFGLGLHYNF